MIDKDDPDQQQYRDQLGNDQVFKTGSQGTAIGREQDQAGGGDHRQFEEDKQVEQVTGKDDANRNTESTLQKPRRRDLAMG